MLMRMLGHMPIYLKQTAKVEFCDLLAVEAGGTSTISDLLGRRLVRQETLENALALPLHSVGKVQ